MGTDNLVEWDCPFCGHANEDHRHYTAIPVCADCGKSTDWWNIPNEREHKEVEHVSSSDG